LRPARSDHAIWADIFEEALGEPGPVVVDAIVDPFEPRMPPKVAVKQAAKTAEALAKGTPNRMKIALTITSDTVREVI
jgi:pyruvate dehydrogenase (quinone)